MAPSNSKSIDDQALDYGNRFSFLPEKTKGPVFHAVWAANQRTCFTAYCLFSWNRKIKNGSQKAELMNSVNLIASAR